MINTLFKLLTEFLNVTPLRRMAFLVKFEQGNHRPPHHEDNFPCHFLKRKHSWDEYLPLVQRRGLVGLHEMMSSSPVTIYNGYQLKASQ